MLFSYKTLNNKRRKDAWLISTVFYSVFSVCTVFLLCLSFLIQPVHKAFAFEVVPEELEQVSAVDVRDHEEGSPVEIMASQNEETPSAENDFQPQDEEELDEPLETVVEEDQGGDADISNNSTAPPEGSDEVGSVGTSTTDDSDSDLSDTEGEVVTQIQALVTEENYYQFSKQSCIAVGNGVFHCSTSSEPSYDSNTVTYAARGESGNMEIFLRTSKNRVKEITQNEYDDSAPHYDPESMQLVWQRLIDGRQQIVLYDIQKEREAQLTFSKHNNMEPKVSANGVVWQAWDGNDWEIMFFDGAYTEQITDNDAQDVAPVIQEGYILWNVLGGSEQQARLYSLSSRELVSIVGHEGGSILNPRFVLVYDTRFDNGDIVTKTLDPATGLSTPVAAKPAPEPIDIPDADPIGEIRALISNKSKDDKQFSDILSEDPPREPPSDPDTLNLRNGNAEQEVGTVPQTSPQPPTFELTEYDLVIPETALEEALDLSSTTTP